MTRADKPVGEWNTFRIIQVGERTTATTGRHAPAPHPSAARVRQVVGPRRPAAPSPRIGSLALTGSNSGGALVGLGSLILGGAIWALAEPGRSHDAARATRRRRARTWLWVTMPGDPT